ncbi:ABC transporter permease subunit [Oenococcus oeni]|uniref:ABC transporter permease subunit n=1 Tax=Oenococcus oeni TaxID=1247 RepID=UPI0010BB4542|nr:ABC transporter permease subunit [Oenococcus oeni]SYW16858.1 aliphatic sulfonate ABC transporter (permease) [Oenococcus oeni]
MDKVVPWIIPVGIIVIWQFIVTAGIASGKLLPAPSDILLDAWKLFKSGELQKNIGISLFRALLGFIIGGGIGFILGVLNGIFKVCRLAFDNTIQMLRNIPHLALIPLIILVIGIGESSKIFLVSVGCMFPMYINTYHGVTSIDKGLVEMGRSYGLSNSQVFFKIIFPGALPTILMGVRYALGVMWTTLIVAETVATSSGIGYMANEAEQFTDMSTVILCILIYALFGKLSDFIAKLLEDTFLVWQNPREIS